MTNISKKISDRFESRVFYSPDGCWYWTASLNTTGYGMFWDGGRQITAHRFSYILHKGEITKECVCHSCDNPMCVNPDHLFLGTHDDNVKDKVLKGRGASGELQGSAKLTKELVIEIRELIKTKMRHRDIAEKYNISIPSVSAIACRRNWANV